MLPIVLSGFTCCPPQLAKNTLRKGKQALRHASRLSSQTKVVLRQASRQTLNMQMRKQELEEVRRVRELASVPLPQPRELLPTYKPSFYPHQMGSDLREMETQVRTEHISLEDDIRTLAELLTKLGKES